MADQSPNRGDLHIAGMDSDGDGDGSSAGGLGEGRSGEEAREAERNALGENALIRLVLPDSVGAGDNPTITMPKGHTVQHLKLLIQESFEVPYAAQTLSYEGDAMIDPFSLSDCVPADVLDSGNEIVVTVTVDG